MARTTDPVRRAHYRMDYKVRCALTNKCKRCPRTNDNPTSLICTACTHRQAQERARRQQAGQCISCTAPQDASSRQLCTRHLVEQRRRARRAA